MKHIATPQPVRVPVRKLSARFEREQRAFIASLTPERRAFLEAEWETPA